MEIVNFRKYGRTCWTIEEHLKNDDSILRILAWQMKLHNWVYDQNEICHGCR